MFILEMLKREKGKPGKIVYIFCSDEYLLEINKRFLKHNYYTDVIGFDLSGNPKEIEAEIYISIDRVRENAEREKVSDEEELHRVIFHGTLHFCGYNDKKREEIIKMKKVENKYISKYFNIIMFHVKHQGKKA